MYKNNNSFVTSQDSLEQHHCNHDDEKINSTLFKENKSPQKRSVTKTKADGGKYTKRPTSRKNSMIQRTPKKITHHDARHIYSSPPSPFLSILLEISRAENRQSSHVENMKLIYEKKHLRTKDSSDNTCTIHRRSNFASV